MGLRKKENIQPWLYHISLLRYDISINKYYIYCTIHQLNEDNFYYYWFQYQGYVRNNKEEQFVVVVVLKARTSSNDYVTFLVSLINLWFNVIEFD